MQVKGCNTLPHFTKRGTVMKKIVALIAICILVLGLCACDFEPSLVGTVPADNSENNISSNIETPSAKTFKLGDVVELNNVTVSFLEVTTNTGSDFNKPTDGNVFVLCEFEISNNSNEELSVSSMLSFEAYCDGYSCNFSLSALMEKGNKNQLDGTVAAGKKIKGVVGYEVPTDWKELEIHYTIDVFSGKEIVFVATNEQ